MRDDLLLHIKSADLREIEIEHDHIRHLLVQLSECGEPVRSDENLEPFHTERALEHLACRVVILDEQNSAPVSVHVRVTRRCGTGEEIALSSAVIRELHN